jgi:hypothetical protein
MQRKICASRMRSLSGRDGSITMSTTNSSIRTSKHVKKSGECVAFELTLAMRPISLHFSMRSRAPSTPRHVKFCPRGISLPFHRRVGYAILPKQHGLHACEATFMASPSLTAPHDDMRALGSRVDAIRDAHLILLEPMSLEMR